MQGELAVEDKQAFESEYALIGARVGVWGNVWKAHCCELNDFYNLRQYLSIIVQWRMIILQPLCNYTINILKKL